MMSYELWMMEGYSLKGQCQVYLLILNRTQSINEQAHIICFAKSRFSLKKLVRYKYDSSPDESGRNSKVVVRLGYWL